MIICNSNTKINFLTPWQWSVRTSQMKKYLYQLAMSVRYHVYCAVCSRVELFWERKKSYTLYVVPNGCMTSIPKCHVFMLHVHLSQGLRKLWVLPWNEQNKNLFFIFKGCSWNKICSLACLKTKTEEKGKKKIFKLFFRSITVLAIFVKL